MAEMERIEGEGCS